MKRRLFVGAVAAALLFNICALARARAATKLVVTHADVDVWAAAWNSHNIDTVLKLFSKNVQIDQPANAKPLNYTGAKAFFSMIFKAYPDFHVVVKQAIVESPYAVSVEQVTGTWSGPFVNPNTGAVTQPNGKKFDHPGAMVITYGADHKIEHVSIYWDQLMVDEQLGIKP